MNPEAEGEGCGCMEELEIGSDKGVWESDSKEKECSGSVEFLVTEVNKDLGYEWDSPFGLPVGGGKF